MAPIAVGVVGPSMLFKDMGRDVSYTSALIVNDIVRGEVGALAWCDLLGLSQLEGCLFI